VGIRTAVVGASGYAGGELLRLLDDHPTFEISVVAASANAGRSIGELHPQLPTLADRVLVDSTSPDIAAAEVVFLALPHGASAGVVSGLDPSTRIVDLGADFRLVSATDWERWYAGVHAGTWPYGLPELPGARAAIASAARVANPGCFATAVALGLAPVVHGALVEPADLVVVAASGTTGAGRTPEVRLLASEVIGDMTPYKIGGAHQHLAEMRQTLTGLANEPVSMSFTPMLAPMPRGILATCTARLRRGVTEEQVRAAYACYDQEPFVTVLPGGRVPHTAATTGSNSAHLQLAVDADAGRVVVVVAIDNLGKGAAGQAVQNANLMVGLAETTGLAVNGVAP
jgi:N-acetyl-gamma-glutamyl-phosphate reductase